MASTITVIGLGYIGLPTAVILASAGHTVLGVDTNPFVVESINSSTAHIDEPGLQELLSQAVSNGLLSASSQPSASDIFIITVPTPFHQSSQSIPSPNIDYVLDASRSIASYITPETLVIIESTCPVGTTQLVAELLSESSPNSPDDILIAYCPERVLPGNILHELVHNDRVIGGLTPESTEFALHLYQSFSKGQLLSTDAKTAEFVKLAENSYRDVNIAYANELSMLCDHLDINVFDAIKLANHHQRVNILKPGCGVGGHCIAVDPWFLAYSSPENTRLIQSARSVNNLKPQWVQSKILSAVAEITLLLGHTPKVGILGLTFKPDVQDTRESPALSIATHLTHELPDLVVADPFIPTIDSLKLVPAKQLIETSDLIVVLVAHSAFKTINLQGRHYIDFTGLL